MHSSNPRRTDLFDFRIFRAKFDLGISHSNVGEILFMSGDMTGALESQRKSLAILESVSASAPGNTEMQYELADSYVKTGDIFLKIKDTAASVDSYNKGRLIFERLAKSDSENAELRAALAETYSALGKAQVSVASDARSHFSKRAEGLREARLWYQRSLDIYTSMRAQNILQTRDANKPDEIAQEIAKCDAALATLN